MGIININGKPAVRIKGKKLRPETIKAYLIDCDGDEAWFPKDCIRFNLDGTVDIQEWIFKKRFPKG